MGVNRHSISGICYAFFVVTFIVGMVWSIVVGLNDEEARIYAENTGSPIQASKYKTFHPGYMILISGAGGILLTLISNKLIKKYQSRIKPAETVDEQKARQRAAVIRAYGTKSERDALLNADSI